MLYEFQDDEEYWIGNQVKYIGCSDSQDTYSRGNSDAREYLVVGEIYTIVDCDVGNWWTRFELSEFPGRTFNSVCFEEVDNG